MKKKERTEQTKENLIKSFWELYKEKNITAITVGNICSNANYNRTTFYRYFNDTSDLLNELENTIIYNIKNSINSKETTNILFDGFEKFNNKYGEYINVFYRKGNNNFYNKFKKLIKNEVYSYLKINTKNEEKKEFIYEFLFSSLINSYVYWYNHENIMDLESFVIFINNMLSNSIKNK